ncbi:MAG TPA: YlxR family protein [Acidothermales bacterium]
MIEQVDFSVVRRPAPVRTCVGCRGRVARTELLRTVVVEDRIVPDPAGRLPGRGASLHPVLGCLDLAERRRAFPRAFRLPGPLDTEPLRAYLEQAAARTPVPSDQ